MWPLPISYPILSTAAAFTPNAVEYPNVGTGAALSRVGNFTGMFDAPTGILSFWLNTEGAINENGEILRSISPADFTASLVNLGTPVSLGFTILLQNSSTGGTLEFEVNTAYAASTWTNILASWDTNHAAASRKKFLYTNDVSNIHTIVNIGSAFSCQYASVSDWELYSRLGGVRCLSEIYFAPGQYLDFSVTANRRKFITASGMPVNLGPTGARPTGTAPVLYLKGNAANVTVNSGTGGDMTASGSFSNCGTHP